MNIASDNSCFSMLESLIGYHIFYKVDTLHNKKLPISFSAIDRYSRLKSRTWQIMHCHPEFPSFLFFLSLWKVEQHRFQVLRSALQERKKKIRGPLIAIIWYINHLFQLELQTIAAKCDFALSDNPVGMKTQYSRCNNDHWCQRKSLWNTDLPCIS